MKLVALDTETAPFSPGNMTPELVLATTARVGHTPRLHHGIETCRAAFDAIAAAEHVLTGVNLAFDLRVIARWCDRLAQVEALYAAERVLDLGLLYRLLAIAGAPGCPKQGVASPGLERLGEIFGVPTAEKNPAIRLTFGDYRFPSVLPPAHRAYALADATAPLELAQRMLELAAQPARDGLPLVDWRLAARLSHSHYWASYSSAEGLRFRPEAAQTMRAVAEQHVDALRRQAWQAGLLGLELLPKLARRLGVPTRCAIADAERATRGLFDDELGEYVQTALDDSDGECVPAHRQDKPAARLVLATRAVRDAVTAAYDGAPPMTAPKKDSPPDFTPRVRVDWEALHESGDPTLVALADYGTARKALTADVPLLEQGIVHSRNSVTNTLRWVTSGPNVSNFGKTEFAPGAGTVREAIDVPEGYACFVSDYPGLETVTYAAHLRARGRPETAQRYLREHAAGRAFDPHLQLAAAKLGLTYDEAYARKAEPEVKAARQALKPCTFGYPVGMTAATFVKFCAAMGVPCTLEQAEAARAIWAAANPDMVEEQATHKRTKNANGRFDFRPLGTGHFIGDGTFCGTLNASFQSPGGAMAALLWRWGGAACALGLRYPALLGCRIMLVVYDELVAIGPADRRTEIKAAIEQLMVDAASQVVGPDLGEVLRPECVVLKRYGKDEKRLAYVD